MIRSSGSVPAAVLVITAALTAPALAQQPEAESDWPMVKCQRYKKGYGEAIARFGKAGLGQGFLSDHDAFLASDCRIKVDVCPRSPEELKLANTLVIISMNAGMASTFVPFNCRK